MRAVLTIIFSSHQSLEIVTSLDEPGISEAQAREWFDQQWLEHGCEPLRASGKVLLLDKIMGVADALGYHGLQSNSDLAQRFAQACVSAVHANRVTVDLPGLSVNY